MPRERDLWSGTERAARPQKETPPARETPAKAERAPAAPGPNATEKQAALDTVKQITRKVQEGRFGDLQKARAKLAPDSPVRNHLSPEERSFLTNAIRTAAKENPKIGTMLLQEGIALSGANGGDIFAAGQQAVIEQMLRPGHAYAEQAKNLLNVQPNATEAMNALAGALEKHVRDAVQAAQRRREKESRDAAKAKREAEERRIIEEQQTESTRGFWGNLFGKK